jgi:hypothetical protein
LVSLGSKRCHPDQGGHEIGLIIGAVGFCGCQSLAYAEHFLVEVLGLLALSESIE